MTTLLATGLCAAYLIAAVVNWGDAAARTLYANLGMIPIGLAAAILALSASTIQDLPRSRWAWRLLGAGLACFWAGDVLFFVYENILGISPFPSPADASYIVYYPLFFAGLLCLPGVTTNRRRMVVTYVLCCLVAAVGAAAVASWLLIPSLDAGDSLLSGVLAVGYPLGDIVLIAGIARVHLRRVSASPLCLSLLTAGLLVGFVADIVYGYQGIQGTLQPGGFSDAAYMVSWALFAWAGYVAFTRRNCAGAAAEVNDVHHLGIVR